MLIDSFIAHPFGPYFNPDSKILILGSFPSPKSREQGFYYSHPQNRFWKLLATIYKEPLPTSIEEKKALLKAHQIALYDVVCSCSIIGASDASMKVEALCDLKPLLKSAPISLIIFNGKKAAEAYKKGPQYDVKTLTLPSTSPANASCSFDKLLATYKPLLITRA